MAALVSTLRRTFNGPHRRRHRAIAVVFAQVAAILALVIGTANPASAGAKPVMYGFIPLPSNELVASFETMRAGAGTTLDYTVGLTNAGAGAVLTYDHWEDGYEADLANPTQSTTLVFGDNDTSNGTATSFCSVCTSDLLPQGAPLIMRNDVPTPRPQTGATPLFDGGDKVASTRGFAITAGGFTTTRGSLQTSVVSAYDTSKYGTAYTVPVGTNTPVPARASNPFAYTSSFAQAANDGTVVEVDTDADGDVDETATLDQGESVHTVGLRQGATIRSTKPIQVHLVTGDPTAQYESRSFALFSDAVLTDEYLSPAGAGSANFATNNFIYNPNTAAITITPTCTGCSGTFNVPAKASAAYTSPLGQAVRFRSTGGQTFIALAGVGAHSGSESASATDNSSSWDWGFTMVPTSQLTSQIVIGWAPGNSNKPPSAPAGNRDDDPIWVTTMGATMLRVDLDGNPNTGAITTPDCFGSHDREISVAALASTRIFDNNDGDMSGARIYTCDDTLISAAWGEDPLNAPTGSPGFDAGYTVIPSTSMVVDKTAVVAQDEDGDGRFSPGDRVTYSVSVADAGSLAFTQVSMEDTLRPGMTYVPGSTTIDDGDGPDPYADDTAGAATAFPFDENGGSIPTIEAGQTVTISFDVIVDNPYLQPDGTLGNTACVKAQEATACDTTEDPLAQADLWLTKDVSTAPQRVGDEATFLLTVGNDGPDDVGSIQVTDVLPAGTTYVSSNPSQGTYDDATGLWDIGGLEVGDEVTLEIVATIDQLTVTNYAQITAASAYDVDSQPAENPLDAANPPDQDDEDSVTVTVDPAAIDLRVDKEATDVGDHVGDGATFEVTVTNDGPSNATGVVVSDPLPAGLTYDTSSATQGAYDAGTGLWTVGSLAVGADATLTIDVIVDANGEITNVAQVSAADQADVDSTPGNSVPGEDDQDDATVEVEPLIDLSVTKDVLTAPDYLGEDATFRITVTNDGPSDATGVVVTDRFGGGLDVTGSTDPVNFSAATGQWNVGDLASGTSVSIDVTATVPELDATNLVEVTEANEDDVDSAPAEDLLDEANPPNQDDEDGADVTVAPSADLRLTKEQTGSPVRIGDEATFEITVDNDGPSDATDVEVTDLLPAGLTYVSHTTTQGDYDEATGLWTVGDIDAQGSATLTIVVTVDVTTATNFAEITSVTEHDPDSEPGENPLDENTPPDQDDEDSAPVTVGPAAIDLHLDKELTASGDRIGDDATFTLTITNDGPSVATGVEVTDQLPAGLTYLSDDPSQGTYDDATGVWTVGTLTVGGSATLELVVSVDTDDEVTNVAEVTGADQADLDSTPGNGVPTEDDQAEAPVQVDPLIDLELTKELTSTPTYVGDEAIFTVAITNRGPSDATGVVVTDHVGDGLRIVSSSDPTAFDNTTGEWLVGDLAVGAIRTIDITVEVEAEGALNLAEVTEANEEDVDSAPAENDLDRLNPPDQDDEDSADVTVAPLADLSLTKEQTGTPTHIGDEATFTIIVRNDGPSDATGVEVTDQLPAGLTFVSADPSQGTYDEATGIWTVGDLAADGSASLELVVTVHTGSVQNFAQITDVVEDDPDSQPGEGPLDENTPPDQDDEDVALVEVAPLIDLSVDKEVTETGTHVGDDVTYRVSVDNDGPSDATGVVLGDLLPAGLTFVSALPSQGTYDEATGRWTVGGIDVGEGATLDITATVTTGDPIVNTAQVIEADQDDVDSTPGNDDPAEDDQADATVDLSSLVDVSLTKELTESPTYLGDEATFTLTVANDGPSDATGVVVTDLLPAGLTYVSSSGGTYDPATGAWTIGNLEEGGTRELTITVTVEELSVTNRAEVTATNEDDVDSQPAEGPLDAANPPDQDDEDQAVVTVAPVADLSLTKSSTPGTVQQGDDATFTLTVRNDGPSTATGVVVTDQLPAGVTYVADDASQGDYDPDTGIWTIGTLALGDEVTLEIDVTVDEAGPITNTAEITGSDVHDPDSTPDNDDPSEDDQDSTILTSEPLIDLSVTKGVSDTTPNVGDEVTYTVTVNNDGPSDATGIEVEDDLPAGVTYVSHEASAGSFDPATGIWAIDDLAVDGTETLTIVVTVDGPGATTNVAQVVDADQDDVDSQPAEDPLDADTPPNQDDEATVELTGQQIDLELDLTADQTVVNVGDQVVYTVTLVNQGPSNATGVAVDAALPPGVVFVGSTPSVGSYDPATGIWTVGDLAVGETVTLVITTTVTDSGEITTIAQVTDADQPDIDSTPANSVPSEDDQDQVVITGLLADLSLTKTISDDAPPLGGIIAYTLNVANDGPSDATGVVVMDPLPQGLEYRDHAGPGTYDPTTGRWEVGTLAAGDDATLTIEVQVFATGTTTNVAWVAESDLPDPDSIPSEDVPGDPTEDDQDQVDVTPIPASLTGLVWLDADGDGTYDLGTESPIPGVTIQLLDGEGDVVAVTTTGADGHYSFTDLVPGTYTVVIDSDTLPKEIAGQTYDPDDVLDGRFEVTLTAGETRADVDFGYELPPEEQPQPEDPDPVDPTDPTDPIVPIGGESPQGDLPVTGSDLAGLAIVGLALLGAGVVLLGGRRRRPGAAS